MEGNKINCSTYSVPGAMSDITILSTPMPQAASTATKSRSLAGEDDLYKQAKELYAEFDAFCNPSSTQRQQLIKISERHLKSETPQLSRLNDELSNANDDIFRIPSVPKPSKGNGPNPMKQSVMDIKKHSESISSDNNLVNKSSSFLSSKSNNATSHGKKYIGDKSTSSFIDTDQTTSVPPNPRTIHSFLRDSLNDTPAKLPAGHYKYRSTGDLTSHGNDRFSIASSANSSLGVIPSDMLCDAQREPLVDMNHDLSLILAEKLNLNTSLLKDGLDISTLAGERYKEKVAAKQEYKENQRDSGRNSSDYWTLHGYSSDNSDSRNNTAKRLSSLSSESGGEADLNKSTSSQRRSLNPLSEMNFTNPRLSSNSRASVGSNPFGSYSNISVNSEDFQFTEDASERLDKDERQFSIASTRSLSGIYGDANFSVDVNGEKLSMASFLRSGSGPLGSLERREGDGDTQRPQFGMVAKSPEKTGRPRAILPLPQDKSTFVVEEEPVRDTPWLPNSLVEQYSNIHGTDVTDSDVSVPSLSLIGDMLEKLRQGANHKDVLEQLMGSQNKIDSKPNESLRPSRISSLVEGENSFCQGVEGDRSVARDRSRLHNSNVEAPLNESEASSVCNITDFDGDEDACVCVMTPQSMEFEIFNELSHPVEYSFTKACYVEGQRNDSAAYVHFPFSKTLLYPGQKKTVTIDIAALGRGVIKIKVEVARRNPLTQARECSYVYGKIVAEIPRVSLMTQHKVEMTPNPESINDGRYQHTIIMKNEGRSSVPLKLTVTKVSCEDVSFYFGEKEKHSVTVMVEPGKTVTQLVQCETPPIFAHLKPSDSVVHVEAKVEFCLATTNLYPLNPIAPVTLDVPLKPYFFGAPPTLVVPSVFSLFNGSEQAVVFTTTASLGYTVQPSSFTVQSNDSFDVTVDTEKIKNPLRYGELTLQIVFPPDMQTQFTVQLWEHRPTSLCSNNSLATPDISRATSPSSSDSSLATSVGELKVVCSHKQLVWGGCHLHQKVVKTFCLKNVGHQREKLRLTISDNSKCFKIMSEEDTLQKEFKLSLQPMDNREIKVAVLATTEGPQWGHLTISRICQAADKNVLPLYAFGGKPQVSLAHGVVEIESKKYFFLDENTLESVIVMSNKGDSCAFFRISEANSKSSAGLSITPQEGLLPAGGTASIHIGLLVTAKRLEYLMRQATPSVCVAKLSIHHGDESTRQRLLRTRGLCGVLATRVSQLSSIANTTIPDIEKLNVSVSGAEGLWEEDTDEWFVGVFIKRSALEALRLDTSVEFVDLSTTIVKH